jgi:hypothetical protein
MSRIKDISLMAAQPLLTLSRKQRRKRRSMSKVVQCDICGKLYEIEIANPLYVEVNYYDMSSNDHRTVHKDFCKECFEKISGYVCSLKCMDIKVNIPEEMYNKIVKESSKDPRKMIDTSKCTYDRDGYLNKV